MKRAFIFSCLAFLLGLNGCIIAKTQKQNVNKDGSEAPVLTAAEDPDGDGDAKGYNYFPLARDATGGEVFIFDPNYGAWALYDVDGKRVNTGRASGGKLYCSDIKRSCKTISGTFKVISKGGANCISSRFPLETNGGAPMPYCMHFSSLGYAIHGSNDIPDHNASHGCIRITPKVAAWLNKYEIKVGTTVIVLPYEAD